MGGIRTGQFALVKIDTKRTSVFTRNLRTSRDKNILKRQSAGEVPGGTVHTPVFLHAKPTSNSINTRLWGDFEQSQAVLGTPGQAFLDYSCTLALNRAKTL